MGDSPPSDTSPLVPPPPKTEMEHQVGKSFQKSTEATGVSTRLLGSRVKAWSALKTGGLGRWPYPPPPSLLPEEMYSVSKRSLSCHQSAQVLPPECPRAPSPQIVIQTRTPVPSSPAGLNDLPGTSSHQPQRADQVVRRPLREGTFSEPQGHCLGNKENISTYLKAGVCKVCLRAWHTPYSRNHNLLKGLQCCFHATVGQA